LLRPPAPTWRSLLRPTFSFLECHETFLTDLVIVVARPAGHQIFSHRPLLYVAPFSFVVGVLYRLQ
jgi:hypothetical protein